MKPREIYLCKTALRVLKSSGPAGVNRVALMEQVGIVEQCPLATAEQAELIERLEDNGWVLSYRDPIRDEIRYVLSGTGSLALGAL